MTAVMENAQSSQESCFKCVGYSLSGVAIDSLMVSRNCAQPVGGETHRPYPVSRHGQAGCISARFFQTCAQSWEGYAHAVRNRALQSHGQTQVNICNGPYGLNWFLASN